MKFKVYESENSSDSSRDNSSHLATPPLVSLQDDIWGTSAETPYWWCVTTQIWIVLLIVRNFFHLISNTASGLWHVISMGFLLSFLRRTFAGKQVLASPNIGCFLRLCGYKLCNVASWVYFSWTITGRARKEEHCTTVKFTVEWPYHRLLNVWMKQLCGNPQCFGWTSSKNILFCLLGAQAAQISRASPAWQSYTKHVSGVVMEGLKNSTHTSLRSMLNQIVFSNMSQVSNIFISMWHLMWVPEWKE